MLTRLGRLLRQRWLILAVVVIAVTAGGVFATDYFNDQLKQTVEATAIVSLDDGPTTSDSGRQATEPSANLTEAQDMAREANEGFLDETHVVKTDPATNSLEFIAIARTAEEATSDASDLRNRYLVAVAPPPIEDRMEAVLAQADFVQRQLELLSPEAPPILVNDPAVETQRQLLTSQIQSLTSERANLEVDLVLAATDSELDAEDIQADIDAIEAQIVGLTAELNALPPPVDGSTGTGRGDTETPAEEPGRTDPAVPIDGQPVENRFQIDSLESLYADLQAEFQALYIRSVSGELETLPEIEALDTSGEPVATLLGGGIGLALGLLIALSAIILFDRLLPRWWTENDMKQPLAEVPDRRSGGLETWYWTTGPSPRKEAVQKVAVNLLPLLEAGPAAVGLVGVGVKPRAIRGLTTDLAGTVVTSGRSSLVVDTTGLENHAKKPDPEAVPWEGPSLGDLLNPWQNGRNEDRVERAVAGARRLWPGLSALPSGAGSLYSVEGAMTPVVGQLVETARGSYALTAVSVADRGTALSDAFVRKLDSVVIVGRSGKTRLRSAEKLMDRLVALGYPVLGSVLIVRPTRRPLRQLLRSLFGKRRLSARPGATRRRQTSATPVSSNGATAPHEEAVVDVREPVEETSASAS
ncbi:MAG: hypothetical protein ACR2ME_03770 [Acidimicrobiia bacterium]